MVVGLGWVFLVFLALFQWWSRRWMQQRQFFRWPLMPERVFLQLPLNPSDLWGSLWRARQVSSWVGTAGTAWGRAGSSHPTRITEGFEWKGLLKAPAVTRLLRASSRLTFPGMGHLPPPWATCDVGWAPGVSWSTATVSSWPSAELGPQLGVAKWITVIFCSPQQFPFPRAALVLVLE